MINRSAKEKYYHNFQAWFSAENQNAIINDTPEDLLKKIMLSKAAVKLRAGEMNCYHYER
ncbi:hypothetical protein [Mucilaginibacter kameinonensis]|uniref:hypothetical protein n=1 Tax=Mucilaginibacter kameinonensis TaxID=452286 RepID=UPI000EF7B9C1|nr:hypothetical protein [Mucilaginibacter kameinonensis]